MRSFTAAAALLLICFSTLTPAASGQVREREPRKYEWRTLTAADVEDVGITGRFGHLFFKVAGVEYVYTPLTEGSGYASGVSASIALLNELRGCDQFRVKFEVSTAKPADRKSITVEDITLLLGKLK